VFCSLFQRLLQCAEPSQLHHSTAFSTRVRSFPFQHGLVGFFFDCGAVRAALRGSTGGMAARPGERDHVSMARAKRYGYGDWGPVTAMYTDVETDGIVAGVIRDTVYLDGGFLWWEPGMSDGSYGAPTNDGIQQNYLQTGRGCSRS
jgi:hypothetical protein